MNLEIDYKDLDELALTGLIENYITSGADAYDGDLDKDVERIKRLLASGELLIVFSEEQQTAGLYHKDEVSDLL